jgi:hypothetical protein
MSYLDSLDLANRACQHIGAPQILDINEDTRQNFELAFAYDKVREAELRRNPWRFATKTAILRAVNATTLLLVPEQWSSATLYLPGAIVQDANGDFWQSSMPENQNYQPGQSPAWEQYFGPMTADVWTATTTYFAGDLVYVLGAAGSYVVYRSLQNGNANTPNSVKAFDPTVTYGLNEVASYSGAQWRSLLAFNLNNVPATQPAAWDSSVTYGTNFTVTGQDGYVYISTGEQNIGNNPPQDGGVHWTASGAINAWSKVPTIYPTDPTWVAIFASLTPIFFTDPIGYGVDLQSPAKALYRLPANFLREAPRDPKAGSVSVFGAPTGLMYNDWLFQGDYLVTMDTGPLMFRFIADITVVAEMDPMFGEAMAARMALGVVETITGSDSKKRTIEGEYGRWIAEARLVNGIEIGAEEPPEDDWVTCRA